MNKRSIIFIIGGALISAIGISLLGNYLNSVDVTISTKHVKSYTVRYSEKVIYTSNSQEPATVRVPKSSLISVEYSGMSGYANGKLYKQINGDSKSIAVNPYLSSEVLASLANKHQAGIENTITSHYPTVKDRYSLKNHTLYHFGDWASVLLVWRGEYSQNSDSLKIILKRSDDTWNIIGKPSLLFHSKSYPDIPVDILQAVNNINS